MKISLLIITATLIAISSCLSSCAMKNIVKDTDYVSPSELNKNIERYEGHQVFVRGIAVLGVEKRYLVDDNDDIQKLRDINNCLTIYEPSGILEEKQTLYNLRLIEIRGIFRRNLPANVIMLGACSPAVLYVTEINAKMVKVINQK